MLTRTSSIALCSDQLYTWSDEYSERTRRRTAKTPQRSCAPASATEIDLARLPHRALQALRQAGMQVCRWSRTWLIWYPSLRSTGKPMTVGDYTQLADTEIHFDAPHPEQNRWRSLLKTSSEIPLWAVRDAKLAKGHYPVLIYAPSDSSVSWENADLCEYLASHG